MISQTLGENGHHTAGQCEYLTLAFSPLSAPLRSRWRNNGLSADFLGDYVTTFLPADGNDSGAEKRQSQIRHAVTYIANELLENAMKYHERQTDIPIGIHLELGVDDISVSASNGVGFIKAEHYKSYVEDILKEDPADLIAKHMEGSATENEPNKSCLGLLTMMNDYGARLGWTFEVHPTYSGMMIVTTRAVLSLKSFPGVSA